MPGVNGFVLWDGVDVLVYGKNYRFELSANLASGASINSPFWNTGMLVEDQNNGSQAFLVGGNARDDRVVTPHFIYDVLASNVGGPCQLDLIFFQDPIVGTGSITESFASAPSPAFIRAGGRIPSVQWRVRLTNTGPGNGTLTLFITLRSI